MKIPIELSKLDEKNMKGFVLLFYSIGADYKERFNTILEIGVRKGMSTKALLYGIRDRGNENLHLYSIDINDCSDIIKDEELKKYWTFIHGDSKKVEWDKEIDVLFIDGNHSYEGIKADYEKYEPFVKENGLILMHDVLHARKGVIKFFWDNVKYPKSILSLSPSGLGIIYKLISKPYDESKIISGYWR